MEATASKLSGLLRSCTRWRMCAGWTFGTIVYIAFVVVHSCFADGTEIGSIGGVEFHCTLCRVLIALWWSRRPQVN